MSPEGSKPIENLLRRYADHRTADAGQPLELHPATRRLLQGEVTRLYRPETSAGRTSWIALLSTFVHRFAYAGAAVTLATLAATWIWISLGPQTERRGVLAQNDHPPVTRQPNLAEPAGRRMTSALSLVSAPSAQPLDSLAAADRTGRNEKQVNAPMPARRTAPTATRNLATRSAKAMVGGEVASEVANYTDMDQSTASQKSEVALKDMARKERAEATRLGRDSDSTTGELVVGGGKGGRMGGFGGGGGGGTPVPATKPMDVLAVDGYGYAVTNGLALSDSVSGPAGGPRSPRMDLQTEAKNNPRPSAVADAPLQVATTQGFMSGAAAGSQSGLFFARMSSTAESALAKEKSAKIALLAQFEVQRQGERVLILDGDGSTYAGNLLSTAENLQRSPVQVRRETSQISRSAETVDKKRAQLPPGAQSAMLPAGPFEFEASGTNRSSGQRVVLRGTITGDAGPQTILAGQGQVFVSQDLGSKETPQTGPVGQASPRLALAPASLPPPPTTLSERTAGAKPQAMLRLEGKLRVGDGPEQPFQALRRAP